MADSNWSGFPVVVNGGVGGLRTVNPIPALASSCSPRSGTAAAALNTIGLFGCEWISNIVIIDEFNVFLFEEFIGLGRKQRLQFRFSV